jgi:hypothetical protein
MRRHGLMVQVSIRCFLLQAVGCCTWPSVRVLLVQYAIFQQNFGQLFLSCLWFSRLYSLAGAVLRVFIYTAAVLPELRDAIVADGRAGLPQRVVVASASAAAGIALVQLIERAAHATADHSH